VITIAIVGGVALVVVLVTRGSFSRLFQLPIQSIWMVVVALAIQIFLAIVELPSDRLDDLGFALVMASYAFLLAFCFVNLRISMMWVIGLGIALNALVIGLNQGMPTADNEVTTRSGRTIEEPIERTAKHRPESDNDLLPFLGDRLRVPYPVDEVISIGDVVIGLGIILVCYQASRVRRPARSRRSERTARIAARLRQREPASPEQPPITTEPITTEPIPTEPSPTETSPSTATEPSPMEPSPMEPGPMEPSPTATSMSAETSTEKDTSTKPSATEASPSTRTEDKHALSHDSPDDTLGVELKEVFARLAADEHPGDAPKESDEDEPHEA
jgi:Family of unknown function (DUF5317)